MAALPTSAAVPAVVPAEAEFALWRAYRDGGDAAARQALLELHLPYARTVAATYYGRRMHDEIEFDDYLQHARVGMLEAFERYDPSRGAQFRTFAARRMHGAILDGIERATEKQQQIAVRQRLRRERLDEVKKAAGGGGVGRASDGAGDADTLFRYLADVGIGLAVCRLLEGTGMVDVSESADAAGSDLSHDPQPYRPAELARLRHRVLEAIDRLAPQQRTVMRYHYLQEHSFEDVATLLGVTRGRVSQIHGQALAALRSNLGSGPGCDVSL